MKKNYVSCLCSYASLQHSLLFTWLLFICLISTAFVSAKAGRYSKPAKDNASEMFNVAPAFTTKSYSFSISEAASLGAVAGSVKATDADGNTLRYTITAGNTNKAFAINSSTGAITVAKYLSYHAQGRYDLTVRATDSGGLYGTATVAVAVTAGTSAPSFSTISWSNAAVQPYGTHEVHGEVVNGKLYVFGGYDVLKRPAWTPTKRAYVYDPATNSWKTIADLPHTPKGTNFGGVTHFGLTTDGTDVYFAGGYTSNTSGTGQVFGTRQVYRYNVASNTYTALPSLPVELAAGQLRYLKGRLHYMGGANKARQDIASHYVLDLDNLGAGWKSLAPLSTPRNHPGSAVYEGKIYFIGGARGQDGAAVTQKIVEVYNASTNTWTRAADMPNGLDHISSSVVVMGSRILVLGGETSHNVRSNAVLAYTPASNTWAKLSNLPVYSAAGVAAVLKNVLHYTGGNFSRSNYKGAPGSTSTAAQKVTSFTLINADTEQAIQTLANGATLNLATLPTRNLNIRANTSPSTVGSVVFNLSGTQSKAVTESRAPYALYGDNNAGDYYAWTPATGSYILKGTPYSASKGTGTAGTSLTVGFQVTNQASAAAHSTDSFQGEQSGSTHEVLVYPNPSTGEVLYIAVKHFAENEEVAVTLYDMLGRAVHSTTLATDEAGTADGELPSERSLKRGLYILSATSFSGRAQTRLLLE